MSPQERFSPGQTGHPAAVNADPFGRPRTLKRVAGRVLSGAIFFGLCGGLAQPAHAGYWTVDHYTCVLDRSGTNFYVNDHGQPTSEQIFDGKDDPYNGPHVKGYAQGGDKIEFTGSFLRYNGRGDVTYPTGTGSVKLSATAYYKWEGDGTPTDYIYTVERLQMYTGREYVMSPQYMYLNSHPQDAPYTGEGFHIDVARDGFNTPLDDAGHVNPFAGGYSSGSDLQATGFWYHPYHFSIIPSEGKTTVPGITRTIQCQISASNGWHLTNDQYADAWYNIQYQSTLANLGVSVRRKGTNDPYGGETTIAAGAKDTNEHEAEVQISAGVEGVPLKDLPPLKLVPPTEQGIDIPAQLTIVDDPEAKTDGNGVVLAGHIRSRDKLSVPWWIPNAPPEDVPTRVELDMGPGYIHPSANVNHAWGDAIWSYQPFYLKEGAEIPVQMKLQLDANTPVQKHLIEFQVMHAQVTVWDTTSLSWQTFVITNNPQMAIAEGLPNVKVGEPQFFAAFDISPAEEVAPGQYKAKLTIKNLPANYVGGRVEQVWFRAVDHSVYYPVALGDVP
jgi:hypothetical protein